MAAALATSAGSALGRFGASTIVSAPAAPRSRTSFEPLAPSIVARSTDAGAQLDRFTYFYDELAEDGVVRRRTAGLELRYFGRFELELLLERACLRIEALYGGYDLAPYDGGGDRLIAVAARPMAEEAARPIKYARRYAGRAHQTLYRGRQAVYSDGGSSESRRTGRLAGTTPKFRKGAPAVSPTTARLSAAESSRGKCSG